MKSRAATVKTAAAKKDGTNPADGGVVTCCFSDSCFSTSGSVGCCSVFFSASAAAGFGTVTILVADLPTPSAVCAATEQVYSPGAKSLISAEVEPAGTMTGTEAFWAAPLVWHAATNPVTGDVSSPFGKEKTILTLLSSTVVVLMDGAAGSTGFWSSWLVGGTVAAGFSAGFSGFLASSTSSLSR